MALELIFPESNTNCDISAPCSLPKVIAHRLPCGIDMSGPAAKSPYYLGDLGHRIHFRGRELRRGVLSLPADTTAYVVETDRGAVVDDSVPVNAGTVVARVNDELVYYLHGADANATTDRLPRATDWLRLAAALHAPIHGNSHYGRAENGGDNPGTDAGLLPSMGIVETEGHDSKGYAS